MLTGTAYALAAGLMWGLVFIVPLLLPQYPAALLSVARYLAFGLIALPLAWFDRARLAQLARGDWIEALKLSAIGNLLYYLCLAAAIQRAGGPLPTMIIGTLPVVIAVSSNLRSGASALHARRDGRLAWRSLVPPLLLIAAGIACVNQVELERLRHDTQADAGRYAVGALLAFAAVACWTWYPIRNADWLRAHPAARRAAGPRRRASRPCRWRSPATSLCGCGARHSDGALIAMPFGPTPAYFIGLMFAVGLFASWLGTLCWNEASQRLPPALAGPLIVFETLSALAYAFLLRGEAPAPATLAGIVLLVAGVVWALRIRPEPLAAEGHTA